MNSSPTRLRGLVLGLLLTLTFLGGCATNNPRDPLEPMNRAVFSFNETVDNAIIKPVAQGYRAVLPQFARTGVSNFFSNINDVMVALNNLLQGKVVNAVSDVGRVLVNTTVGIAGFFDVATHFGLEKHNEDFGQTLGRWGVGDGPYLVLPFIGSSNVRDTLARVVDFKTDPITYVRSMSLRNSFWGTRALSDRANLLDASKLLETAALDAYEFVRDAYRQRRRNLIYDGAPPREKDDDASVDTPAVVRNPDTDAAPVEAGRTMLPEQTEDMTKARTDAAATEEAPKTDEPPAAQPAATPAAAPQAEFQLPEEPTAAGGDATDTEVAQNPQAEDKPAQRRASLVRVWAQAAQ